MALKGEFFINFLSLNVLSCLSQPAGGVRVVRVWLGVVRLYVCRYLYYSYYFLHLFMVGGPVSFLWD